MNRKFNLLFIITIFLSMQAFSLVHASKYGFEEHEHNGKACDICLSADNNKLLNNNLSELITPNLLTSKVTLPKEILPFDGKDSLYNPRAPPFFPN
ncbi:MAG: hypothetical protein HON23_01700 [Rickettsiales bacterium]|jgi:hypothetical protein|nr:hypothetical protein [Rickettsiales bacterium]